MTPKVYMMNKTLKIKNLAYGIGLALCVVGSATAHDDNDAGQPVFETIEPGNVTWGSHAANMAWITLQRPVRVSIHASEMLPKDINGST